MVIYMASASGKSTTKSRTNSKTGGGKSTKKSSVKTTKSTRANSASSKKKPERDMVEVAVVNEVMLITILAAAIFVFLCVSGIIHGTASESIKNIMFGLFGLLAYVMPIIVFLGFAFSISNKGNTVATVKL
ncbi:MAG: DNA translocase FtsK, partial [Lachnospiraceae bacterium]|nr:DNA translocase FtsK [Lachnospiraceae bacterium]